MALFDQPLGLSLIWSWGMLKKPVAAIISILIFRNPLSNGDAPMLSHSSWGLFSTMKPRNAVCKAISREYRHNSSIIMS
ncbi:hypothetical protein QUC31_018729 [Theobroma cacao]|uniref:Uncharacterized protein n=1 Tax=Theobroma cacao TaxID=3641 RepID=A0A061GVF9_THECC|nr:Uncharacterized protein TCM_041692 [Theobroma cacao]